MAKDRGRRTRRGKTGGRGQRGDHVDKHIAALLRGACDHGLGWEDVADDVLPVFERARPFTYELEPAARAIVPPGVSVGFGVDLGIAFARVGNRTLESWPIDLAGLTDRALRNLRQRVREARDYDLVRDFIDGTPTAVFQSRDGWASTAVLIPEAVETFFGPQPALLVAPSRDLLVALPRDVDIEFATWIAEEFEADDPNALHLEGFDWCDGVVTCRPLARAGIAV